jgi:hypothetical protein
VAKPEEFRFRAGPPRSGFYRSAISGRFVETGGGGKSLSKEAVRRVDDALREASRQTGAFEKKPDRAR